MRRYLDFSGKIIFVTGSTRGLGFFIAEAFAERGATIIINGRSREGVEKAKRSLSSKGYRVEGISADVADEGAVKSLVSEIKRVCGGLDTIINNAAIRPWSDIENVRDASWERILNVNLLGVFHVVRESIPLMEHRQCASIINISSIAALRPPKYYNGIHYIVSKGALLSLTRGLAKELAPRGIRVNAVTPGPVDEPNRDFLKEHYAEIAEGSPLKKLCTPHDVASACLFLASDMAEAITGENIIVGGY